MRYSELLGISEGKAYIAVHELPSLGSKKWSKKVCWIESEKLDPKLLQIAVVSKTKTVKRNKAVNTCNMLRRLLRRYAP